MDWGLIDPKAPKEAPFLREEMIYGSKWYYYFAILEDFILRLSWVMNVSLAEAWSDYYLFPCLSSVLLCYFDSGHFMLIFLFVYWRL